MIELLRAAADGGADHPAVVTDDGTATYADLVADAEAVAAGLRARGITRLAVLEHDAAAVIALWAGASLAGVELCQYPPDADAATARTLAERFDHDVAMTARTDLDVPFRLVRMEDLHSDAPAPAAPPRQRPLLVLTTGTTGEPRGVRHDWHRVLRATSRIAPAPGQRWLLAYGLHQFAGLQVTLHVLAAGATLVAPAPRRPRQGLAAMRVHGVTHASATPTYWRFLLAELDATGGPPPALRQLTLGGEAVPAALLAELADRFPAANISQVYAASEFGSTGSVRDGRNGLSAELLRRGDEADVALRVVDGELWVRSRVGMLGYYGDPPVDADAWRPTGDLVELHGDRLKFRGRTSDVINVGGVKVHPLPVEERVAAVPGVQVARVFGRPNAMTGAIVAVEIVPAAGADADAIAALVRSACTDLPAASRPRSVRFVDAIATAGDKIVRREVST